MMKFILLWSFNLSIVQVEFRTESLCEEAKTQLIEQHGQTPDNLACVRVWKEYQ